MGYSNPKTFGGAKMKSKSKWAVIIATAIIVSLVFASMPSMACFGQTTSCEGESVYQGDGGGTDYWYDDLIPPAHYVDPGMETEWIIGSLIFGG